MKRIKGGYRWLEPTVHILYAILRAVVHASLIVCDFTLLYLNILRYILRDLDKISIQAMKRMNEKNQEPFIIICTSPMCNCLYSR